LITACICIESKANRRILSLQRTVFEAVAYVLQSGVAAQRMIGHVRHLVWPVEQVCDGKLCPLVSPLLNESWLSLC
jgi:hypothetical protein